MTQTSSADGNSRHNSVRVRELDGIRGIAVLAVIAHHYLAWLPQSGAKNGWLGVDLFFVLSGFLITSILVEMKDSEHYFKTFYYRRALRIFPPYLLVMIVYLVISIAAGRVGSPGLWLQYVFYYTSLFIGQPPEIKQHVLVLPVQVGLSVLWSLSVEEIYYTIWAPIVRFTNEKSFVFILIGMLIAAPALRWYFHTPQFPEVYTFYCRMDGLAYGSIVALLFRFRQNTFEMFSKFDRSADLAALAASVAAFAFWVITKGDRSHVIVTSLGFTLADIAFALIVFAAVRHAGGSEWWWRAVRAKWLRSVGMVSYSLYLVHWPLRVSGLARLHFINLTGPTRAIADDLSATVLSLGVAYALWFGMESKILKLKDWYKPSATKNEPLEHSLQPNVT
jgi:peptidoglycan/LPS O-acetylase OafA/YrhL